MGRCERLRAGESLAHHLFDRDQHERTEDRDQRRGDRRRDVEVGRHVDDAVTPSDLRDLERDHDRGGHDPEDGDG